VSGNGYADKNVTNNTTNFPAAGSGVKSLATQQEWPAAAGSSWGRIVALSLREGGAIRHVGWLIDPIKYGLATAADNTIQSPAHGLANGSAIRVFRVELLGTMPGGLTHGDRVFVINQAAGSFQVSATQGGAAIDITSDRFLEFAVDRSQQIDDGNVLRLLANQLQITHVWEDIHEAHCGTGFPGVVYYRARPLRRGLRSGSLAL
jgi:hypothetical protein